MTTHDAFLELAAAGVDFPLSSSETDRLGRHLRDCPACARSAASFHSDAAAIGMLRRPVLPARRADELLAQALRPGAIAHPIRLVLVAALLGLLLVGSLFAGSRLLRDELDPLDPVPPPAVVIGSPAASPGPSVAPTSPGPSAAPAAPAGVLALTRGDGSGRTWIETVDLVTGEVTRLGEGRDPAWMGRSQVAYTCSRVGGDFDGLCYVRLTDRQPSTIAEGADRPAPAPDNALVAIHRGMIDVGETWLVRADGNDLMRIASGAFLQWSPDGTVLLGQPESAEPQVATIAADGTGLRVLAPGYGPAWSPDGTRIAYLLGDDAGVELRVLDVASGASERRWLAAAPAEIGAPAWLPGDRLVFVVDGDLWRLDAGSTEPVRLTSGLEISADGSAGPLAVSHDGAFVAFVTGTDQRARIGTANVDGGWALLDLGEGPVTQPAWAPGPATLGPDDGPAASLELGDAWTQAAVPPVTEGRPVGAITAVTAGAPGFVAVGLGCTGGDALRCEGVVWTSPDGRAWMRAPAQDATMIGGELPMSGPTVGMLDVAAGDPGFVAMGYAARPDLRATAWFSRDGLTWTRTTLDGKPVRRVNAVTWDGARFVIVGEDRDPAASAADLRTAKGRAAVWASTDGTTWTRVEDAALAAGGLIDTMEDPTSGGMFDVVAGPGGLVGVGMTCRSSPAACSAAAWYSADGSAWQRADLPELSGILVSVASTGSGYVATGRDACDASTMPSGVCPALVLVSPDGRSWSRVAFPQDGDLASVTRVGDRLFATTDAGAVGLWVSRDGATWTPATVQPGAAPTGPGTQTNDWRFAARDGVAVWLGTPGGSSDPAAWFSEAPTP